jgi:hypothetical protein
VPAHSNAVATLPSSTAQWNGQNQTSQFVSANQVTFALSPADANTEGIFPVQIVNPAPGGGASNSKNVIIDGTPPVTTPALSGPQNANNHGWYKGDVTVNLTTSDRYSGVHQVDYQVDGGLFQHSLTGAPLGPGSFNTPPFTVSGEGKHSVNYQSDDNLGNAESQQTQEIDIDGTPPSLSVPIAPVTATATSSNGANVTLPTSATDSTSGVAALVSSPASGSLFPLGSSTVSTTATDNAGNSTPVQNFTVIVTCDWSGFLPPINSDNSSVFKLGSTIPVKFQLTGASAGISNAAATFSFRRIGDLNAPVNETVSTDSPSSGSSFRYDATAGQYIYNWSTKGLTAGVYELQVNLGDGVMRSVRVGLK